MRHILVCGISALVCFTACWKTTSIDSDETAPFTTHPFQSTAPSLPAEGGEATPQLVIDPFKMANTDTTGWVQSTTERGFRTAQGEELFDIINGGAEPYIEHEYVKLFRQEMLGPEDEEIVLIVVDFGSADKAQSFFHHKTTTPDLADVIIPGYDTTIARGYNYIGGIAVYIKYDNIYIDMQLSGIVSETPIPDVARSFIDLLFKKAGISTTGIKVRR